MAPPCLAQLLYQDFVFQKKWEQLFLVLSSSFPVVNCFLFGGSISKAVSRTMLIRSINHVIDQRGNIAIIKASNFEMFLHSFACTLV